jgi:hypothetical protein
MPCPLKDHSSNAEIVSIRPLARADMALEHGSLLIKSRSCVKYREKYQDGSNHPDTPHMLFSQENFLRMLLRRHDNKRTNIIGPKLRKREWDSTWVSCVTGQQTKNTNVYKETVCHFIYFIVKSLIIVEPEDSCASTQQCPPSATSYEIRAIQGVARIEIQEAQKQ